MRMRFWLCESIRATAADWTSESFVFLDCKITHHFRQQLLTLTVTIGFEISLDPKRFRCPEIKRNVMVDSLARHLQPSARDGNRNSFIMMCFSVKIRLPPRYRRGCPINTKTRLCNLPQPARTLVTPTGSARTRGTRHRARMVAASASRRFRLRL